MLFLGLPINGYDGKLIQIFIVCIKLEYFDLCFKQVQ